MTEISGIQTDIQKQSYLDADIEEYDYIAEPFACEICKRVAKGSPYKVLKMKKALMLHTCIPIANALLSLKLVKIMKSR